MHPGEISDWNDFLKGVGCVGIVDYGDWIMCNCVFHEQTETIRPSMGINKDTGWCNCFSCGSHTWEDFCKVVGIEFDHFIVCVRQGHWEQLRKKMFRDTTTRKYKRFKLPKHCSSLSKQAVNYFRERSFDIDRLSEYLKKYNIVFCDDSNSRYEESILFPICDEKGMLYFQARYVGQKKWIERWRHPKDSPLWKTYWNFNNVKDSRYVILNEGITDSLKLVMHGLPAIPAKSFSEYQWKHLFRLKADIIFTFYDNDDAGEKYTEKAFALFRDCGKKVIRLKYNGDGDDPGSISDVNRWIESNPELQKVI